MTVWYPSSVCEVNRFLFYQVLLDWRNHSCSADLVGPGLRNLCVTKLKDPHCFYSIAVREEYHEHKRVSCSLFSSVALLAMDRY
jgi:hypothetical protein